MISLPPLPLPAALEICQQLLSALQELHAAGVLCRNLSLANLIIPTGAPASAAILTDFGLACSLVSEDIQQQGVEEVLYLSPELAGSIDCEVGPSSDLYAVGALLFQLLAGQPPYQGDTVGAVSTPGVLPAAVRLAVVRDENPRGIEQCADREEREAVHDSRFGEVRLRKHQPETLSTRGRRNRQHAMHCRDRPVERQSTDDEQRSPAVVRQRS